MDRVVGKALAVLVIVAATPIVWVFERWARWAEPGEMP